MLVTIALVVFVASIIVFFSEELTGVTQKTFKNHSLRLVVPLFVGSWILVHHQSIMYTAAMFSRLGLYYIIYFVTKIELWRASHNLWFERFLTLFFIPCSLLLLSDLFLLWKKPAWDLRYWVSQVALFCFAISSFLMIF